MLKIEYKYIQRRNTNNYEQVKNSVASLIIRKIRPWVFAYSFREHFWEVIIYAYTDICDETEGPPIILGRVSSDSLSRG